MADGDLLHELGELDRDLGRDLVAGFLGEARVAREVGEHHRADGRFGPAPHAGLLERGLDVLELVLGHVGLGVAAEEPRQHLLARTPGAQSDLGDGCSKAWLSPRPRWRYCSSIAWCM